MASEAVQRRKKQEPTLKQPTIVPAPEQRHLPFPLTEVQQAYWIGRSGVAELGHVSTHCYTEFDSVDLDLERLNFAWQRIIDRHDMLRAIVLPDGQQQILKRVPPYQIEVLDLRDQDPKTRESELEAVRERMSHQVLPSDQWPLFEIRASRLDDHRIRLHVSIDALILDFWSRRLLFTEWSQLYQNPETPLAHLELSFRDYVLAEVALRDSDLYRRAQDYWQSRIPALPPAPQLPLAKPPRAVTRPRFTRHAARLDLPVWLRLKNRSARAGLTPSGVLLGAFAEVLKIWSKSPRLTINLTLFGRHPLHPQVGDVVGDFTSLSLLEVDNSTQNTFEARARRVQEQLWEDLDHRYVSGVQVQRELARRQRGEPRAVMPVVFTSAVLRGTWEDDQDPEAWLGDIVYEITQTPQVWIDHQVSQKEGALEFNWDVVEELFPEGLVKEMFSRYCRLLQRLADDEESWQSSWPETARQLVPPVQLEQRAAINATETSVSARMLHTLFVAQMSQRSDQAAVIATNRILTYKELYHRANQVGHRLRQLGARPNMLVAVVMEKGWEQVVAVLGVLQSGAAYLPIDPKLPKERVGYLLENGEVELVLTQSPLDESLAWPECVQRVCVDQDLASVGDPSLEPVGEQENLAYVIYTSGSTGLPKGVMIDHRGAVNTILNINRRFGVGSRDRVLALSSLSFDLSVYDIFGTLAAGGTIIVPESPGTRDPAYWADLIARERVTIWNSVPALMGLLVEYAGSRPSLRLDSLRLVLLSGDWIPVALPDQIKALVPGVQVVSLGGATEASIWSILHPIEEVHPDWKSIPYGRPMVNQQFHVLNEALEPCPVWVPGQLYIGGVGLAKGYWRDEEKTRTSFITHPHTGARLYCTGDMGRYLPDGNIEFLGREDLQVKIQGYRVELGEIKAALAQHPAVRAVAVRVVGKLQENKRLVAYFVPEHDTAPAIGQLRAFLQQKLPEYMVPSAFVSLECLPLTPNGKVDRRALPDPPDEDLESLEQPTTETTDLTTRISRLAAGILKVEYIDPQTNLLSLGATSVDMIRIANLLESELNFRPKMDEFYRVPTIVGLTESYEQHRLQGQRTIREAERTPEPLPKSILASFRLLTDPEEREAFKNTQPGLRGTDDGEPPVQWILAESDGSLREQYAERRSYRHFGKEPIAAEQFGKWMSCLRQRPLDGKPKYLYASAGGLYPVQTYLYIKPGRVETLAAGVYYYHPKDHRLMLLSANVDLDRGIYDPFINAPVFDEAAFAVFLIAQLGAVVPMYGERSLHYASIEAGLMSQLLEMSAPAYGMGLCQIGTLEFQRIRHFFALDEGHVLVHSLLGGLIDTQQSHWLPHQEPHYHTPSMEEEREEGEI